MKYGLILLAACLPLAVLTADSFFSAVEVPASPPEPDWQSAEKALKQAEERLPADAKAAKLFSEATWSEEIHKVDKLPPNVQKKATKSLAAATRFFGRAQVARRLAARFQDIPWEPRTDTPAEWLDRAQRWFRHMEEWEGKLYQVVDDTTKPEKPPPPEEVKGRIVAILPESGDVFTRLAGRVAKVKADVEVCADVEKALQLFNEKKADKYKECLELVVKVLKPDAAEKIENAVIRELAVYRSERLRKRAAFWLARSESPPPPLPWRPVETMDEQQVRQEIEKLSAFFQRCRVILDRYPHPGKKSDADFPVDLDRKPYEELVERQKRLQERLRDWAGIKEIQVEIEELAKARNLAELRKSASAVKQKIETNQVGDKGKLRESARESVRTWLATRAFPPKQPPKWLQDRTIREAVDNVNQRRIGWWSKGQNQTNWRFSPWNDPKKVELIGELPDGRQPGKPMYVQWADNYNSEDTGVGRLTRGASQEQWKEFFDRCQKWQEEYETYQGRSRTHEEPDKSCKDWNFLPEKSVLPHRDLDDLCKQLAELQGLFAEKAANK